MWRSRPSRKLCQRLFWTFSLPQKNIAGTCRNNDGPGLELPADVDVHGSRCSFLTILLRCVRGVMAHEGAAASRQLPVSQIEVEEVSRRSSSNTLVAIQGRTGPVLSGDRVQPHGPEGGTQQRNEDFCFDVANLIGVCQRGTDVFIRSGVQVTPIVRTTHNGE